MNSNEIIYWSTFYKNFNETSPSNFACFVVNYFNEYGKKIHLLDIGCGNGRDSYYLSKHYPVTGIDISNVPNTTNSQLRFIQGDMTDLNKNPYDVIYSRFTFHSISNEQQEKLIQSIEPNTFLCIETRSIKDKNEYRIFGDAHYRNLTDMVYLVALLEKYQFTILYSIESKDLAVYKDENPTCIRIICKN